MKSSTITIALLLLAVPNFSDARAVTFTGTVIDADSEKVLPCRVYVRNADGGWLFVKSASKDGSALAYREQWVPMPDSVEKHTTISAHPFQIELEPGRYSITIERGKEYFSLTEKIEITDEPVQRTFRLKRWINMAARGWYSGETHVHRRVSELPNVQLAEDLNVAFPVTFWTINAHERPGLKESPLRRQGPSAFGPRKDHGPNVIHIDPTHLLFPRNTEYEIFSIKGKRHVLGAVFVLNHRTVFQEGMPPVSKIAELAHQEGALLDLDKHSWPWAMMLVPVAKIDLYELSNNSVWRTKFGFRRSAVAPADYMNVETDADGAMTEWGWLNFGFENYYSLLNCGFRLQPTAGTASGVHPVPMGYSRVYVQIGPKLEPNSWLKGLRDGRSFVTTGPMLFGAVNGKHPGEVFKQVETQQVYTIDAATISDSTVERVEIILNGKVAATFRPETGRVAINPPVQSSYRMRLKIDSSSWLAMRCVQRMPDGRVRFAHTAPWHVEVKGSKLQPRAEEVEYLVSRVKRELERNRDVLSEASLAEFQRALATYERLRGTATGVGTRTK